MKAEIVLVTCKFMSEAKSCHKHAQVKSVDPWLDVLEDLGVCGKVSSPYTPSAPGVSNRPLGGNRPIPGMPN